ncbi:MAG: hypothetical protein G01um101456_57 [Parcubacteria group bacterium Gr01-1014_56]|nr:MAG: hypothetical protein G01um101456_57 [Parcubacteria group bacterium Gr01-1014_56]
MKSLWINAIPGRKRWVALMCQYGQGSKESHKRDFDLLKSHHNVSSVYVAGGNRLCVKSNLIFWQHPGSGENYFLGRYTCSIALPVKEDNVVSVVCIESGRRDREMTHPYSLNTQGSFCFGSRGGYIAQLLKQKEYITALYVALDSLWSVEDLHHQKVRAEYELVLSHNSNGEVEDDS